MANANRKRIEHSIDCLVLSRAVGQDEEICRMKEHMYRVLTRRRR